MEWFKEWFNTPYYHILYGNRNYEEASFFIDNLLAFLQLPEGARCWDLNCGKGRHSIHLNAKGYDVIGTDLSEESIRAARAAENEKLRFYTHDMRGLFYTNYFDAVFNLFTSFGYFKHIYEDEKVFQSVYNSLKPGGFFVIDFINIARAIENLKAVDEKKLSCINFHIEKKVENGFIVKNIEVQDGSKHFCFHEEVKILTEASFRSLAAHAGFRVKNIFGNYNLQEFNAQTSDRLLMILEK